MSRKKRLFWRRALSILLTVLIVSSGLIRPAYADETTNNITVNTDGTAKTVQSTDSTTQAGSGDQSTGSTTQTASGDQSTDSTAQTGSADQSTDSTAQTGSTNQTTDTSTQAVSGDQSTDSTTQPANADQSTDSKMSVQAANVSGKLSQDDSGLANIPFSVHNVTTDEWFDIKTDQDGNFEVNLSDGKYELQGVWIEADKKWYQLDQTFTVTSNKLEGADTLLVNLPTKKVTDTDTTQPSVTGKLTNKGTALANVQFSIHTTGENQQWFDTTTNDAGEYSFSNLPAGEYQIDGVWVEADKKWYALENKMFTVTSETTQVDIELSVVTPQDQVTGTVTKDGQMVPNVSFSIHTTGDNQKWYDTTTDANGKYGFETLPDGEYQIDGIWIDSESKWYPLDNKVFTIANGGPADVSIELGTVQPPVDEKYEVKGTLTKNTASLKGVSFSIHSTTDTQKWYDAATDENGNFSLKLPKGSYQLDGVWLDSESKWYQLDKPLTVEGNMSWDVSITVEGISGTVTKDAQPVKNAAFSFHTTGDNPQWFDAKTDENGQFILPELANGQYQIDGIWVDADAKWYTLGKTFDVVDGKLSGADQLNIELLTYNVKGSLVKDAKPLSNVWISIHTTTGDETWFNTQTNETGEFKFNLPDGDYQLEGVWVSSESKWYADQLKFSVKDGKLVDTASLKIDLTQSQPNINGVLTKGGAPLSGITLSAHTVDGEEKWYDAKSDANGRFQFDMPDGNYQIEGIWVASEAKWYPLAKKFSVVNGVLDGASELTIDIQPPAVENNVTGVVSNGETKLAGITVNAHTVDGDEIWYSAKTDKDGAFGFNLPDGTYGIEGIWVSGEKKWYPLAVSFSIKDGKLVGDSALLIDVSVKGNVHGTLTDENGPLANAEMTITDTNHYDYYYVDTDENGKYSLQLPDGSYYVQSAWWPDENPAYINKRFDVTNGKLTVEGTPLQKLDLTVPPKSFNVQVVNNGTKVTNVTLEVSYTMDGNTSYIDVNPTDDGSYSLRLNDGDYRIEGYYSQNGYYYLGEDIKVANGTTNPSPYIVDITNDYTTVNGTVHDSNGILGNLDLWVADQDGNSRYTSVDDTGKFSIELPNGEYTIRQISSEQTGQIYEAGDFTVTEGKISVNGNNVDSLDVNVPDKTMKVKIVNSDGNAVQGYVNVEGTINGEQYSWNQETDENGILNLRVIDGDYSIVSIWNNDNYYDINQTVTVANGTTNPSPYVIDLAYGNVTGTVADKNGPIANTGFYIQDASNDWGNYYWINTDENGSFSVTLPDGKYVINQITTESGDVSADMVFTVNKGKVAVNGQEVSHLDVQLPSESLKVKVVNHGTPVVGELNIYKQVDGYQFSYVANTDENGEFVLRVPDGVYNISDIYLMNENWDWYQINQDVEVVNGTTNPSPIVIDVSEKIEPPAGNVQGYIQDSNGPIYERQSVELENSNGDWLYAESNLNGEFGIDLLDGEYTVVDVNADYPIFVGEKFVVQDGQMFVDGQQVDKLAVTIPKEISLGKVSDGTSVLPNASVELQYQYDQYSSWQYYVNADDNGEVLARLKDGEYHVRSIYYGPYQSSFPYDLDFTVKDGQLLIDGNPTDSLNLKISSTIVEGYVTDNGNPVDYTYVGIDSLKDGYSDNYFSSRTDENGKFTLRLPDGNYFIENVNYGENGYTPIGQYFDIVNGKLQINGNEQSSIQISIPEVNVTGQLLYGSNILANADVVLRQVQDNFSPGFTITTDENGKFTYRLPDGTYEFSYVRTENYDYYDLNYRFEVKDGKPNHDFSAFDISQMVPKEITGKVTNGYNPVQYANFSVKEINTNEETNVYTDYYGQFNLNLPNGEYAIDQIELNNGEVIKLNQAFKIVNSTLYVDDVETESLEVTIPAPSFIGQMTAGGVGVGSAQVYVRNDNTGEWYYPNTNKDGYFTLNLADGDYTIDNIETPEQGYVPLNRSFKVENGTTNPSPFVIDMNEVSGNVQGVVTDENGPVSGGSITVENSDGFYVNTNITSEGKFGINLEDGNYQVTNVWNNNTGSSYPNTKFTVTNGKIYVDGSAQDNLSVGVNVTVKGVVLDNGTGVRNAYLRYSIDNGYYGMSTSIGANENGEFSLRLGDGSYSIDSLSLENGQDVPVSISFEVKNGKLLVDGVEQQTLNINLPSGTVGSLVDENGNPVSNTGLYIYQIEDGTTTNWYSVQTDDNGQFTLRFPDGEYWVEYADYNGMAFLNKRFVIKDNKVVMNGEEQEQFNIQIPAQTIQGQVVDGDTALANAEVNFTIVNDFGSYGYGIYTDENGHFSMRVADGSYQINGVYYDGQYYRLNLQFDVVNGVPSIDLSKLDISAVNGNIKGQVLDGDTPLSYASVSIDNVDTYNSEYVEANKNGEFGVNLPDGNYQISYINSSVYNGNFNQEFAVEEGKLKIDGESADSLIIKLPPVTTAGQVFDGQTPVDWGYIYVQNTLSGDWYNTNIENGHYSFRLPDGDYKMVQAWANDEESLMSIPFKVVDGQTVLNGSIVDHMDVTLPSVISGNVLEGNQPIAGTLYLRSEDSHYSIGVNVDENGNFTTRLADGQYTTDGFNNTNDQWLPVENVNFTVQNGQLSVNGNSVETLNLHIVPISFTGTLLDGTTPLSYSQVSVVNKETGEWFYEETDDTGKFSFRIPDGNYYVESVWNDSLGNISMNYDFSIENGKALVGGTVQSDIQLSIPGITLQGMATYEGNVVPNAYIAMTNAENTRNFTIYTDDYGRFSERLSDGDYVVKHVSNYPEVNYLADTSFSIVNGQLQIDGVAKDELTITEPSSKITGQFMDGDSPVPYGDIQITRIVDGIQDDTFNAQTDETGSFTLHLPDGEYRAIHTQINDTEIYLNSAFEVKDGKLYINGSEAATLTIQTPQNVITGRLVDEAGNPVPNVNLYVNSGFSCECGGTSIPPSTNDNGEFSLKLPDGNFTLVYAYKDGFNVDINKEFKVENGKIVADGNEQANLLVTIPPISFTISIVNGTSPIPNAYFEVRNVSANERYGYTTDANGQYATILPDGEYVIDSVYDNDWNSYPIQQSFKIENGKINPSPLTIDVSKY